MRGRPDDWAHINSITQDSRPNGCHCLLFSLRQQSAIVNVRLDDYDQSPALEWIIADKEGWTSDVEASILDFTPDSMADDRPSGQHSIQFLNEDASLVLFDNGTNRGIYPPQVPMGGTEVADQYNANEVRHYRFDQDNKVFVDWSWPPDGSEYAEYQKYIGSSVGSVRYLADRESYLILLPPPTPGRETEADSEILQIRVIEVREEDQEIIFEATIDPLGNSTNSFQVFMPELLFSGHND